MNARQHKNNTCTCMPTELRSPGMKNAPSPSKSKNDFAVVESFYTC